MGQNDRALVRDLYLKGDRECDHSRHLSDLSVALILRLERRFHSTSGAIPAEVLYGGQPWPCEAVYLQPDAIAARSVIFPEGRFYWLFRRVERRWKAVECARSSPRVQENLNHIVRDCELRWRSPPSSAGPVAPPPQPLQQFPPVAPAAAIAGIDRDVLPSPGAPASFMKAMVRLLLRWRRS